MLDDPSGDPLDPLPDVPGAVASVMPGLRRVQWQGWAAVIVLVPSVVAMVWAAAEPRLILLILALAASALVLIWHAVKSAQENTIMPLLAAAIGFRFDKSARYFAQNLPSPLLPESSRTGEDLLIGQIGAHELTFAEIKVETGGKNSRTLFKGVVIKVSNALPLPEFCLLRLDQVEYPGIFVTGPLSVDDLVKRGEMQGPLHRYGVWTSPIAPADDPARDRVIEVLMTTPEVTTPTATLYSAISDGAETFIAFETSEDLFAFRGLLATSEQMGKAVQRAFAQLSIPLALLNKVLEAEAELAAISSGKGAVDQPGNSSR